MFQYAPAKNTRVLFRYRISRCTNNSICPLCMEVYFSSILPILSLLKTSDNDGMFPGAVPISVHFATYVACMYVCTYYICMLSHLGDFCGLIDPSLGQSRTVVTSRNRKSKSPKRARHEIHLGSTPVPPPHWEKSIFSSTAFPSFWTLTYSKKYGKFYFILGSISDTWKLSTLRLADARFIVET